MRKKYILYLLFIGCSSVVSNAQVIPGYQGKRTYIEYNNLFAPTIIGVSSQGNKFGVGAGKSLLAWSSRHKVNLNYVTKRNAEIGGSISTITTGLFDENNWLGSLRFTGIGFNYNRYLVKSTGALAPLGRYLRFETQYVQAASYFVNQPRLDFHFAYFGAGVGSRTVLKNVMTLNLSFQSGVAIPLGRIADAEEQMFRKQTRLRMQSIYVYEANIGIGFLMF